MRNRSAAFYRSGVTSGISVFMETKPLYRAPATLGGVGDSDPDVTTPVLCWLFPGWSNPSKSPQHHIFHRGSCMGTLECRTPECQVPDRGHVLDDRSV